METEVKIEKIDRELQKHNVTEAVIAQLQEFKSLRINGIEDKEGYKAVHNARMTCRDTRVLAQKICKKGREDAVLEQRRWLAKEKEVVGRITEVEVYLIEQEEGHVAQIERLKEMERRKQVLPQRRAQLDVEGFSMTDDELLVLDDQQFNQAIVDMKLSKLAQIEAQQEEADRKAKEEAERKAALAPDKEKLNIIAGRIDQFRYELIQQYTLQTDAGISMFNQTMKYLINTAAWIRKECTNL